MRQAQLAKQIVAYVAMAVLFFGSFAFTEWMKDVPASNPKFFMMLAMSGPTLVSLSTHGSFAVWLIAIALVLAPIGVAIRKDRVSWRTAAWSFGVWLIECVSSGGPFLLFADGE